MNPFLLFENILEDGTLAASSAAAGYPAANVLDWRKFTAARWKANSVTPPATLTVDLGSGNTASPDTLIIGGHNLASAGARFKVQGSTDNFSGSIVDLFSSVTPTTNADTAKTWTAAAYRYFRVYIDKAAGDFSEAPQLGIVTLGRRYSLPYLPGNFDPYTEQFQRDMAQNDFGDFLGADYRYSKKPMSFAFDVVKDSEINPSSGLTLDDDLVPHLRSKPCWVAWNLDIDGAVYLAMASSVEMPLKGSTSLRQLTIALDAVRQDV